MEFKDEIYTDVSRIIEENLRTLPDKVYEKEYKKKLEKRLNNIKER